MRTAHLEVESCQNRFVPALRYAIRKLSLQALQLVVSVRVLVRPARLAAARNGARRVPPATDVGGWVGVRAGG